MIDACCERSDEALATSQVLDRDLLHPVHCREQLSVLVWHWGRRGAGAKFTFELAASLSALPRMSVIVSASQGSDLSAMCADDSSLRLETSKTYRGDKTTGWGKIRALAALARVPALARHFRSLAVTREADVLLCAFQSFWDFAAFRTIRTHHARYVLVLHDASFHPGDTYPLRTRVLAKQILAADALIVLSEHVSREAQRLYAYPPDRIWTIPHGAFRFGSKVMAARRTSLRKSSRLLFLGRILHYKGLGSLLHAYDILRSQGKDLTLEIAGDGDLSSFSEEIAAARGVTVKNRWLDDSEIESALSRADIVVLPYIEASQSGVAVSAASAGVPVVVTPVGGLSEQVIDGETGVIAAGISAPDVAAAIARLVDDDQLYERCSAGALRYAAEVLDWHKIALRLGDVLEEVRMRPHRLQRK